MNLKKKVVLAITGGSGFKLGMKVWELLPDSVEKYLIVSDNSKIVSEHEEGKIFNNSQIDAPMASGSFGADIMLVIPTSMNSLAKISVGIADNLVTRTASVMIKERKTLLLAPRELPFSPIHLENMQKLSQIGVIIAPPVLGYYSEIQTLDKMENFLIGKWFDAVGIENNLFKRWE
ncbi:polyprenyl p-hydroxybenzoate/phenylacrylic acid decarboxylase [Thiovulum sp. ES]|nr:polyprenyl p-hydroxybenzoate/phenylacrylic acid decarboxylase [Thiovulum sp. ES]